MIDLTAFIAGRLDEDEATARAGPPTAEFATWFRIVYPHASDETIARNWADRLDEERDFWNGIAGKRQREVAAKRAIVAEHEPGFPAVARQEPPGPSTVTDPDGIISTFPYCLTCDQDAPCVTLEALAAVWSDHPDYRQEWAIT